MIYLFRISSYEKVFKGLVNLSLTFLGATSSILKSLLNFFSFFYFFFISFEYLYNFIKIYFLAENINITNQVHQLGLFIIVSLVQKRSFITGSVLRNLTDFITSNPTHKQYLGI